MDPEVKHSLSPSRITLCLSGGGFRATIFHAGVVDYLTQTGRLRDVKAIYGVSGGAILAAHLAQNWDRYCDPLRFGSTVLPLLSVCHHGLLDAIIWRALVSTSKRTLQLSNALTHLLSCSPDASAPPTWALCSSLTDTSQFGFDLKTGRLIRMSVDRRATYDLGKTRVTPLQAVAMSACFPLVFQPLIVDGQFTGLDASVLGRDHVVADGGIVDNFGLAMACAGQPDLGRDDLVIVSDAGNILDDLDSHEAATATLISPLRTIDYLMNRNAQFTLQTVREDLRLKGVALTSVRLSDLRQIADQEDTAMLGPGVVRTLMRLRTNFDAFSIQEIGGLYNAGLKLAIARLSFWPHGTTLPHPHGVIAGASIDGISMPTNLPALSLDDSSKHGLARFLNFLLNRPSVALCAFAALLVATGIAFGVALRAFSH